MNEACETTGEACRPPQWRQNPFLAGDGVTDQCDSAQHEDGENKGKARTAQSGILGAPLYADASPGSESGAGRENNSDVSSLRHCCPNEAKSRTRVFPSSTRRGGAKRRGGAFKKLIFIGRTTPPLRGTPPWPRRGKRVSILRLHGFMQRTTPSTQFSRGGGEFRTLHSRVGVPLDRLA